MIWQQPPLLAELSQPTDQRKQDLKVSLEVHRTSGKLRVYEMSPQGRHLFTDVVEEIYDGLLCYHIAYYFKKQSTAS